MQLAFLLFFDHVQPLRIEYTNAFYHVMNRGAARQPVYQIDDILRNSSRGIQMSGDVTAEYIKDAVRKRPLS